MNTKPIKRISKLVYSALTALALACSAVSATGQEVVGSSTRVGSGALGMVTSGIDNTAFGGGTLEHNTTGNYNTAIGVEALTFNNADNNTAIGENALVTNDAGSNNTAAGFAALASNTAHSYNTATGFQALQHADADDNTASGALALNSDTTGQFDTATGVSALFSNTTGSDNTASGVSALYFNVVGHDNAADGFQALLHNKGSGNVGIGSNAGANLTTGSNNIDIGANVLGTAGEANKIRIGKQGTQNGTFVAGIYNITEPVANGIKPVYINSNGQVGTTPPASSARFKDEIKSMDKTSEAILALKPVTFHYKNDDEATPQFGLIAEEVAKVNPDLVVRDEDGEIYTVRYDAVNAMLLNEFLKEHRRMQDVEKDLRATIATQQKQIEALSAGLQKVSAAVELNKPAPTQVADNR